MVYTEMMSRDFGRMYMPSHDLHTLQVPANLQPPLTHQAIMSYHASYPMHGPNATPAPYEMTAGAGGGAEGAMPPAQIQLQPPHAPIMHTQLSQPLEPRKRKGNALDWASCSVQETDPYELPANEYSTPTAPAPRSQGSSRKRRPSSFGTSSTFDDNLDDDSRSNRTDRTDKKQNHSEIEKRRRDKMNTYITELSSMIPMCGAMARKLDKLTVLRIAVQHLRVVRGALNACPLTARPTPNILSERELNSLVLNAAHDSFVMVVGCDRGRLLYVSASVKNMLHYNQSELLGQSLFDLLHPKDVAKVKEQLSSSDLSPRERLIDAKTMLPLKTDVLSGAGANRLCPGVRRSFFCRIKAKPSAARTKKEEHDTSARKKMFDKKYCVVQCTGYLKSWLSTDSCETTTCSSNGEVASDDGDACNLSCLVAVARALPDLTPATIKPSDSPPSRQTVPNTRPLQYTSRHATDGKYLFVDQRVTLALGFLPQELLGTSLYEYVRGPGVTAVACAHKQALLQNESQQTPVYTFRKKDGTLARVKTHFKPFRNPWTKDVECLVANNTIILDAPETVENNPNGTFELFKHEMQALPEPTGITETDTEMQRLIESQVESQLESHKIGSAIAEEALRRSPPDFSPELPADLLQDAVFNQQQPLIDTILCPDVPDYCEIRNNVSLNSVATASDSCEDLHNGHSGEGSLTVSPPLPPLAIDGNGEAAMAVIMSLLEADAGLGGPVNFSGLPWPLP